MTLTLTPWLQGTVGPEADAERRDRGERRGRAAVRPSRCSTRRRSRSSSSRSASTSRSSAWPWPGSASASSRPSGAALSIDAGFGPGQLRDVALEVTYNPDRPEDTTVTGSGDLRRARPRRLRLNVDGGAGRRHPGGQRDGRADRVRRGRRGGRGVGRAPRSAGRPATGVVLDAHGEIFVEPKFKFGIDAFVDVSADLWITEIELYHKTWKLAAFEYGSNLRFGLALPIHYESGKPFDALLRPDPVDLPAHRTQRAARRPGRSSWSASAEKTSGRSPMLNITESPGQGHRQPGRPAPGPRRPRRGRAALPGGDRGRSR